MVLRTYLGSEDLPRRIEKERFLGVQFQIHICMLQLNDFKKKNVTVVLRISNQDQDDTEPVAVLTSENIADAKKATDI